MAGFGDPQQGNACRQTFLTRCCPVSVFNLHKLIKDVFNPQPEEMATFLVDYPTSKENDTANWKARREMAAQWREEFLSYGLKCPPLIRYKATGANNADLPESADQDGKIVVLKKIFSETNILLAFTQYSATAPLSNATKNNPHLRVASMPGVEKRMEQTALAANYNRVAELADSLCEKLTAAQSADVTFSTEHRLFFDLRFRRAESDNGRCHQGQSFRLINLPSGEAFIVPYEGERNGIKSLTAGEIPLQRGEELVVLRVEENRICAVQGDGSETEKLRAEFAVDEARRNIAELGLGCNDRAVVTGCVLEDEKAGMHWAYGRSDHLGGITGTAAFSKPEWVVHHDVVYAPDCPIGIQSLTLNYPGGSTEEIMRNSIYV